MFKSLRTKIYGVLVGDVGNQFAPIRLAKNVALVANDVVGRPFATAEEFVERNGPVETGSQITLHGQAPVVVFHIDRLPTELYKIVSLLEGEGISYMVRAIGDDEAAISAAKMDSQGARFPMVFIAGDFVGGAQNLTKMVSSGELRRLVFPSTQK